MTLAARTYRGVTIDRTPSGEWWRAWCPGEDSQGRYSAYLFADTLAGLKALIRERTTREAGQDR